MFDFAWSEIALIGVVALIAIGPKDMPVAIKAVTDMIKKARRMASEFQTHVDDMMKDANLGDVRDQINDLRTMDIKGRILRAVDGDGTLQKALKDDPFKASSTAAAMPPASAEPLPASDGTAAATLPAPSFLPQDATALDVTTTNAQTNIGSTILDHATIIPDRPHVGVPAFIPPPEAPPAGPPSPPAAPAFIPPNAAQPRE